MAETVSIEDDKPDNSQSSDGISDTEVPAETESVVQSASGKKVRRFARRRPRGAVVNDDTDFGGEGLDEQASNIST